MRTIRIFALLLLGFALGLALSDGENAVPLEDSSALTGD
jgi:hypothetical protein